MKTASMIMTFALLAAGPGMALAGEFPVITPLPRTPVQTSTDSPRPSPDDIACRIHGNLFYIVNFGGSAIDSGRQVSWASPTTDDGGVILLPKMLAPGEEVKLAEVLSHKAKRGAPCKVAFV